MCLFLYSVIFKNWFLSIFVSIWWPICCLKHPSTTSSNPSFLLFVQFQFAWCCLLSETICQWLGFLLSDLLLQTHLPLSGEIHGDWVSNATSPNPKKTYGTRRKLPSAEISIILQGLFSSPKNVLQSVRLALFTKWLSLIILIFWHTLAQPFLVVGYQ